MSKRLLEGHSRPITQNLIASGLYDTIRQAVPTIVTWYAAHQTSLVPGWTVPWVIVIAAIVFFAFSLGIHFIFNRPSPSEATTEQLPDQGQSPMEQELIRERARLYESQQLLSKTQEKYDDTEQLRKIAKEQADSIYRFVSLSRCVLARHDLLRPNPYIEFQVIVTNRSVYDIGFAEISGVISIAGRELSGDVKWTKQPNMLTWGNETSLSFRQNLNPDDALFLLSLSEQQPFDLFGLEIKVAGATETSSKVSSKLLNLPMLPTNEALLAEYPKLNIDIEGIYAFIIDVRDLHSNQVLITVKANMENPRKQDIRIESVRLAVALKTRQQGGEPNHVVALPRAGAIYKRQFVGKNGELQSHDEPLKNLIDEPHLLILGQSRLSGYFQFLVEDVGALDINEASATLTIIDKIGQKFTGSNRLSGYSES